MGGTDVTTIPSFPPPGNLVGNPQSHTIITRITTPSNSNKQQQTFRSGKWTTQEEAYANRLIEDFTNGVLEDVEEGATLRSWLSKRLNCSPMRISKKFVGNHSIGKRMFKKNPQLIASFTSEQIRQRHEQLQHLKKAFQDIIENEKSTST